jgi:hypothetical protein
MLTDPLKILDLEKKYFDKICEIINSDEFINSLKYIENYIIEDYDNIKNLYKINNPLKLAFEKLCSYYIPFKLKSQNPFASPISCDVSFFNKEALFNIDAKTIDEKDNKGDVENIQLSQNQFSFNPRALLLEQNIEKSGLNFKGFPYKGNLKTFEKNYLDNKVYPNLNYLIKCIYSDDEKGNFSIKNLYLTSIMNGHVYKEIYPNSEVIRGFKNYNYYDQHWSGFNKLSKANQKKYSPIKINNFNKSKYIKFIRKLGNKDKEFYLSKTLKDPLDKNYNSAWVKTSKNNKPCFRAIFNGDTGRLKEDFFLNRFDSLNNTWSGIKKIIYPR